MNEFKCKKCGRVYDNALQIEFHICLPGDPIEEALKRKKGKNRENCLSKRL